MENAIVISLLVVILVLALLGVANRLRGSCGCCGGKRYRPKKKRLSAVRDTCVFTVSDMHCENCKRRVEEAVNALSGVSCRVDLKKGRVTVYAESEIDRDAIKRRIEQAGYSVCDSL